MTWPLGWCLTALSAKERRVDDLKTKGNGRLSAGDPQGAAAAYGEGIELCLGRLSGKVLAQLYVHRAQARARLEQHLQALEDAEAALREDAMAIGPRALE